MSPSPDRPDRILDPALGSPDSLKQRMSFFSVLARTRLSLIAVPFLKMLLSQANTPPSFFEPKDEFCAVEKFPKEPNLPPLKTAPFAEHTLPKTLNDFFTELIAYTESNPPVKLYFYQTEEDVQFSSAELALIDSKCISTEPEVSDENIQQTYEVDFIPQSTPQYSTFPKLNWFIVEGNQGSSSRVRVAHIHCDLIEAVGLFVYNRGQPIVLVESGETFGTLEHELGHDWVHKNYPLGYRDMNRFFEVHLIYDQNERDLFALEAEEKLSFRQLNELFARGFELTHLTPLQARDQLARYLENFEGGDNHLIRKLATLLSYVEDERKNKTFKESIRNLNLTQKEYQALGQAMMAFSQKGMGSMENILKEEIKFKINSVPGKAALKRLVNPSLSEESWAYEFLSEVSLPLIHEEEISKVWEAAKADPYAALVFADKLMGLEGGRKFIFDVAHKNIQLALIVLPHHSHPCLMQILEHLQKLRLELMMTAKKYFSGPLGGKTSLNEHFFNQIPDLDPKTVGELIGFEWSNQVRIKHDSGKH